jgi:pimeloyl-ACP methyl ester carboxylesterase
MTSGRHLLLAVPLLAAAALAGCGTRTSVTDRLHLCEIDEGPRGVLCGELRVFEDREAQSGREIDLKIVVALALDREPKPDPVFVVLGGPGGGAATTAAALLPMFSGMRTDRDIVLVDQRGTGSSNPLDCERAEQTLQALIDYPVDRFRRCLASLDADPRFYLTAPAMDDLDDVRRYLGYGEINLWGVSYGTRAALTYLARHGDSVRSLVLDSAASPTAPFGLYLAPDSQRALDRVIADCAADAACNGRFPELRATIDAVLEAAADGPAIRIRHPRTGAAIEGTISRELVAGTIMGALYSPTIAALLPQLLSDAARGDFQGLLGLSLMGAPPERGAGEGAFVSVVCAEDAPRFTRADAEREGQNTFLGNTVLDTVLKPCAFWPAGAVTPELFAPVVSAKPVLVLSGAEDPVTPPRWGALVVETLRNGRQVVVPGAGHGVSMAGCVPSLIAEFLATADAQALDVGCLATLRRPPFFTSVTGS